MKYELIENSNRGILIDRMPVMQDIRATYEVSFLMPKGSYIALFKGADGIEYKTEIKDGVCKVPKELLGKEQFVELLVCQVNAEKITHSWECEPIKISAFLNMRKTQWEISGGMTESNMLQRLNDIEKHIAEIKNKNVESELQTMRSQDEDMKKAIAQLESNYQETVKALAGEIVKQNKLLQELSKDISAIKNEPLI